MPNINEVQFKLTPMMNSMRRYVTNSPSSSKISALLTQIDNGDIAALSEMHEEITAKDLHYNGVSSTRKKALTGLEWRVVPYNDDPRSIQIADDIDDQLRSISSFETTLEHLTTGIFTNLAVSEIIYKKGRVVDFIDINGQYLQQFPYESNDIYVQSGTDYKGIKLFYPKFIQHTPNANAGFPFRVNIARAEAKYWLIKHMCLAAWSGYTEIFGVPFRYATIAGKVTTEEKTKVAIMLRDFAMDGFGVFEEGITIDALEVQRSQEPFSNLINWIEKKESILILGQTLTTELGSTGSYAAAQAHELVRQDFLKDDIKKEQKTIREQLLKPMTELQYGTDEFVPYFERIIPQKNNIEEQKLILEQLKLAKEFNLNIDEMTLYEKLQIQPPKEQ